MYSAPWQEPWERGKKYPQGVREGETDLPYHSIKIGNERRECEGNRCRRAVLPDSFSG